jgi:hypothetical protein
MLVTAYDEDSDEDGKRDDLVATGTVEPAPDWLTCKGSKWVLRIDGNGVRHESDLRGDSLPTKLVNAKQELVAELDKDARGGEIRIAGRLGSRADRARDVESAQRGPDAGLECSEAGELALEISGSRVRPEAVGTFAMPSISRRQVTPTGPPSRLGRVRFPACVGEVSVLGNNPLKISAMRSAIITDRASGASPTGSGGPYTQRNAISYGARPCMSSRPSCSAW